VAEELCDGGRLIRGVVVAEVIARRFAVCAVCSVQEEQSSVRWIAATVIVVSSAVLAPADNEPYVNNSCVQEEQSSVRWIVCRKNKARFGGSPRR
jgi:hypothetical protein